MKKLSILMSALLVMSSFATMAVPAAAEEGKVLAHWKLQNNPAYFEGDVSEDKATFFDLSGNGNTLVTAVEGNGKDLYVFDWDTGVNNKDLSADANKTAFVMNNSLAQAQSVDPYEPSENNWTGAYTSGKYLETVENAPLNSWTGEGGWTVEVIFKVSPEFNMNYNRYVGLFSRQGVVPAQEEPPFTLALTEPTGQEEDGSMGENGAIGLQFVHLNGDANKTNNEFQNGTFAADQWIHFMATNDGELTDIYINGEYESTIPEDDLIYVTDPTFSWEVGVGRKDFGSGKETKNENHIEGIIRRLFCGAISEIKVTAGYSEDASNCLMNVADVVPEGAPAAAAPAEPLVTDYYASKTDAKITVDGKKDAGYTAAPVYVKTPADEASAAGATGTVYVAWDNEYLYVFNEVIDAAVTPEANVTSMWSDDGMEVYINLSGEEADYYNDGINAGQYTCGPFFSDWGGGGYHRDYNRYDSTYAWEITDKGYNMEFAIYWGDEFEAAEGKQFRGFFAVNDSIDGDPSTREYRNISTPADMPEAWHIADNTWPVIELAAAGAGVEAPAVEEEVVETPVVEEVVETPAVEEEVVETPAVEEVVVETPVVVAPQTFDFGVIAAIAAIVSAAGYAISKKR